MCFCNPVSDCMLNVVSTLHLHEVCILYIPLCHSTHQLLFILDEPMRSPSFDPRPIWSTGVLRAHPSSHGAAWPRPSLLKRSKPLRPWLPSGVISCQKIWRHVSGRADCEANWFKRDLDDWIMVETCWNQNKLMYHDVSWCINDVSMMYLNHRESTGIYLHHGVIWFLMISSAPGSLWSPYCSTSRGIQTSRACRAWTLKRRAFARVQFK